MTDHLPSPPLPMAAYPEKPGMVTAVAVMTLVNGILNILWGFLITLGAVLGSLGWGCLCAPLTILPAVLGVFEIVYAAQLLSAPPRRVGPSQVLAIFEICMILAANPISLIVGILALVFYNDPLVRAYFAAINAPRANAVP
ncbi:MAG TPA: hypothetical protein VJJ46_04395 [Anaerolineales bacterium]|nr:hypothetical protein [Anaerolineales bacterium]